MGLYDRDYMNHDKRDKRVSFGTKKDAVLDFFSRNTAVKVLILINVLSYILGYFVDALFKRGVYENLFELSLGAILKGKVWTILTYSFLHADLMHISFNMLMLYFIGTPLVQLIGERKFVKVYIIGGVLGGLVWLLWSLFQPSAIIGASAAVMAVFGCFLMVYPASIMHLAFFGIFPFSIRPINMFKIAVGFEVIGVLFAMISHVQVAYISHLAGITGGYFCAMLIRNGKFDFFSGKRFSFSKSGSISNASRGRPSTSVSNYKVDITNPQALKKEVDRILDKINNGGFSQLTNQERETLQKAKNYFK